MPSLNLFRPNKNYIQVNHYFGIGISFRLRVAMRRSKIVLDLSSLKPAPILKLVWSRQATVFCMAAQGVAEQTIGERCFVLIALAP